MMIMMAMAARPPCYRGTFCFPCPLSCPLFLGFVQSALLFAPVVAIPLFCDRDLTHVVEPRDTGDWLYFNSPSVRLCFFVSVCIGLYRSVV